MSQLASLLTAALVVVSCGLSNELFSTPTPTDNSGTVDVATTEVVDTPSSEAVATTEQSTTAQAQSQAPAPQTTPTTPTAPSTQSVLPSTNANAQATTALPIYTDDGTGSMDRVERRQLKAQRFAATIDSLVQSHSFIFLPNSMQEIPGGWLQMIYSQFYYVGVMKDHVEVHMPIIRGTIMPYYEILNFDTFDVKNYQASRAQFGWNISFNLIAKNDMVYTINMMIYTSTGETVLNLLTISNTIRYVGYLQSASSLKQ